jgi:hypothetical protein
MKGEKERKKEGDDCRGSQLHTEQSMISTKNFPSVRNYGIEPVRSPQHVKYTLIL